MRPPTSNQARRLCPPHVFSAICAYRSANPTQPNPNDDDDRDDDDDDRDDDDDDEQRIR